MFRNITSHISSLVLYFNLNIKSARWQFSGYVLSFHIFSVNCQAGYGFKPFSLFMFLGWRTTFRLGTLDFAFYIGSTPIFHISIQCKWKRLLKSVRASSHATSADEFWNSESRSSFPNFGTVCFEVNRFNWLRTS